MPTFDTPEPISVAVELDAGNVRIAARKGAAATTVTVQPSNPARDADVKAAQQTAVDYAFGALHIKAPKQRLAFRRGGSVDVVVELPAGSHVAGHAAMAELRGEGPLGDVRFKTSMGDIRLDHTTALDAETSYGNITVDHVTGAASVTTGSGDVHLHTVQGAATVKNGNGATRLGDVGGDLRVKAANGAVTVDRAHAAVTARTANGDVRIGEVARGSAVLETAAGDIEIGIRKGTAAWLDVGTTYGTVRNLLDAAHSPDSGTDDTVEVRAGTSYGDITIRRA